MRRNKGLVIFFLALVFLLPAPAAYLLFSQSKHLTWTTTNKGQLIRESKTLATLMLTDYKHQPINEQPNKWVLLIVSPKFEKQAVFQLLDKGNRVRLALGKDMTRTRQWLVIPDKIASKDKHLIESTQGFATKVLFSQALFDQDRQVGQMYLIDPRGNLVLSYPLDVKHADLYSDFTHLLSVSKLG